MSSKTPKPRATIAANALALADAGDGNVMFAIADDGRQCLRVCAGDGTVVEDIAVPDPGHYVVFSPGPRFVPTCIDGDGRGLFVGTRTHNWGEVLFARRGMTCARLVRPEVEFGVTEFAVVPDRGALVWDLKRVAFVREDGTSTDVMISPKESISRAEAWNDEILVATHDKTEGFQFAVVAHDGTVRLQGAGAYPIGITEDTFITFDQTGVLTRDRAGVVAGRLDVRVEKPNTINREVATFARVDEELVFNLAHGESGLVRWHPRVDAPRWKTVVSSEDLTLESPLRVGRFVAITSSVHGSIKRPSVWVLDAETGAVVHTLSLPKAASRLVAVGDDALVAVTYSKKTIGWRGLGGKKPERVTLEHEEWCCDAVSPAPGVVVTRDRAKVHFFEL
jgi:hypothetical protein